MKPKLWPLVSSRLDRSYRIFDLRMDRSVSPRTGEEHDFIVLESAPWVNVIALTDREEVVLIRQYRHGIREVTLEIPGGLVEAADEPPAAAKRELLEETGYRGEEWIDLGYVHPNPAIQNNRCHTFLALGAKPAGAQSLDDKEDIAVVLKPLAEIPSLIREGAITHALVVCAFWRFFMEYRPGVRYI
ncbi:MAG: NUDIX hydrolase [Syntrophales bacterium]|nr:NUDIX hydrolase [Syntrophales bacterium]